MCLSADLTGKEISYPTFQGSVCAVRRYETLCHFGDTAQPSRWSRAGVQTVSVARAGPRVLAAAGRRAWALRHWTPALVFFPLSFRGWLLHVSA